MVGKQLIENVIKQIGTKVKTDYVHKEAGKGLSTEDYTTLEKAKLAGLSNYDDTQIRAQLENKADKSEIPDVSNFITNTVNDLVNYYKKTETYTQNEIDQMVSRIPKFKIEVVQELPQTDISNTTIYLLVTGDESQNLYTEYIYVNNTWEKLGTQKLDISNLATKQELSDGLANKVDKVNGKGLSTNDFTNEYKEQIETNASDILNINEAQTTQDNRIAELEEENELLRQDIDGIGLVGTATGESIDIADSAEARFSHMNSDGLEINGNSKQETTTGKNKVDVISGTKNIPNTLTLTQNADGTLTLNGNTDGTLYYAIQNMNFANIINGNSYKLVTKVKSGSWNAGSIGMQFSDSNRQQIQTLQNTSSNQESKAINGDVNEVNLYLTGAFNATNLVIEIMLVDATISDDTYEPYTGRTSKSKSRIRTAST